MPLKFVIFVSLGCVFEDSFPIRMIYEPPFNGSNSAESISKSTRQYLLSLVDKSGRLVGIEGNKMTLTLEVQ